MVDENYSNIDISNSFILDDPEADSILDPIGIPSVPNAYPGFSNVVIDLATSYDTLEVEKTLKVFHTVNDDL